MGIPIRSSCKAALARSEHCCHRRHRYCTSPTGLQPPHPPVVPLPPAPSACRCTRCTTHAAAGCIFPNQSLALDNATNQNAVQGEPCEPGEPCAVTGAVCWDSIWSTWRMLRTMNALTLAVAPLPPFLTTIYVCAVHLDVCPKLGVRSKLRLPNAARAVHSRPSSSASNPWWAPTAILYVDCSPSGVACTRGGCSAYTGAPCDQRARVQWARPASKHPVPGVGRKV